MYLESAIFAFGSFASHPVHLQAGEASSANTLCFYSPPPPLSLPTQQKASQPGFHGLKIGNDHFPLGLAATKWKCQIVPLIHPSMLFEENDNAPSSTQLRFAIASIMRQAWQLDIARSCKLLKSDKN
jgi:hypothetical protein